MKTFLTSYLLNLNKSSFSFIIELLIIKLICFLNPQIYTYLRSHKFSIGRDAKQLRQHVHNKLNPLLTVEA